MRERLGGNPAQMQCAASVALAVRVNSTASVVGSAVCGGEGYRGGEVGAAPVP